MAAEEGSYAVKAWEFPSPGSRSGFEDAINRLESTCYSTVFFPEDIDSQSLRYGEGLAYLVDKLPETIDGSFEFVQLYRNQPASKTMIAQNPRGFMASLVTPAEPYSEIYVIDTAEGAAVAGDQELLEHFDELMTGQHNTVVDLLLES